MLSLVTTNDHANESPTRVTAAKEQVKLFGNRIVRNDNKTILILPRQIYTLLDLEGLFAVFRNDCRVYHNEHWL
jgi:hypothetical protein